MLSEMHASGTIIASMHFRQHFLFFQNAQLLINHACRSFRKSVAVLSKGTKFL